MAQTGDIHVHVSLDKKLEKEIKRLRRTVRKQRKKVNRLPSTTWSEDDWDWEKVVMDAVETGVKEVDTQINEGHLVPGNPAIPSLIANEVIQGIVESIKGRR